MTTPHSPLPWRIDRAGDIVDREGQIVVLANGTSLRQDRVDILTAVNNYEKMRKALEPFAAFADPRNKVPDNMPITQGSEMARKQLTMGDCYRARAALTGEKP